MESSAAASRTSAAAAAWASATGFAADLDHQPAGAARQLGHRVGALGPAHHVDQPGVQTLHGVRRCASRAGTASAAAAMSG